MYEEVTPQVQDNEESDEYVPTYNWAVPSIQHEVPPAAQLQLHQHNYARVQSTGRQDLTANVFPRQRRQQQSSSRSGQV